MCSILQVSLAVKIENLLLALRSEEGINIVKDAQAAKNLLVRAQVSGPIRTCSIVQVRRNQTGNTAPSENKKE